MKKEKKMIDPDIVCAFVVLEPNKVTLTEWEIRCFFSSVVLVACWEDCEVFVVALNSVVQLMAAEEVIQKKEGDDEIKLFVIESHDADFPKDKKTMKRYKKILQKADKVLEIPMYLHNRPNDACNEWLIDHVKCIVPIYTGDRESYRIFYNELCMLGKDIIGGPLFEKDDIT